MTDAEIVQAIRDLCLANQAPADNGRMVDVDSIWPSEVLAIIDGPERNQP